MRFQFLATATSLALFSSLAFAQTNSQSTSAQPQAESTPTSPAPPQSTTTPPLRLESLPPDPHTPTPEEQAEAQRQRTIQAATQMASAQARWGAPISTPGISLTLKETSRSKTQAGTEITYQLTGTGFPAGEKLTLLQWPLNGNVQPTMDNIAMDASGTAICTPATDTAAGAASDALACEKTFKANAPVEIKTTAAQGEAIRVALVTADKKKGAAGSTVPFPLNAEDKSCKLYMLLGTKDADLVLIEGDGFPANTAVTLESTSYDDKHPVNAKADAQGHLIVAILPGVKGHDSGQLTITPQNAACSPSLTFPWGKGTYKAQ